MPSFLLGLVVGVVINIVTAWLSREKGMWLLPWFLFYLFMHGTFVLLRRDNIQKAIVNRLRWGNLPMLYFVTFVLGGVGACAYLAASRYAVDQLDDFTRTVAPDLSKPERSIDASNPKELIPPNDLIAKASPVTSNTLFKEKPNLIFDGSKLLTEHRKEFILREITAFHNHLLALNVDVEHEPVRVQVFEGSTGSWQSSYSKDGAVYNNGVGIPTAGIYDRKVIVQAYSQYVFSRLAAKENRYEPRDVPFDPHKPVTWNQSKEEREFRFRNELSRNVAVYLSQSYLGKQDRDPLYPDDPCVSGPDPVFFPIVYWWDIEKEFRKEFANTLAVFTVMAAQKSPLKDPKMTMYQYVAERMETAQGLNHDRQQSQKIRQILNRCGFLNNIQ